MLNEFATKQFMIFLFMGCISATVSFITRIFYSNFISFPSAVVLAHISGMITFFILVKFWVFKQSTQETYRSVFFFCLVNAIGIIQTLFISLGLAYYLLPLIGIDEFALEISHMCGIAAPAFTSYIGHKYWSFSERKIKDIAKS